MRIRPFPWKSLFLGPFASVPAFTIAELGSSGAGVGSDLGWGIILALLLAVPASFFAMLLIGVPLFLILRPYKYTLLFATCTLGFGVPFYMFFGDAPFRTTLGAVASGVMVAIAGYFLRPDHA
jgi:hypothetical protein